MMKQTLFWQNKEILYGTIIYYTINKPSRQKDNHYKTKKFTESQQASLTQEYKCTE